MYTCDSYSNSIWATNDSCSSRLGADICDISLLIGAFGLFFTLFLLFLRFVPMIAISEVKGILPEADPHHGDSH